MITFVTKDTIEKYIHDYEPKSPEEMYEENPNLFLKLAELGKKNFDKKEVMAFVTGCIMTYDIITLQLEKDKTYET